MFITLSQRVSNGQHVDEQVMILIWNTNGRLIYLSGFSKILERHEQHPKTLTIFFILGFVMNFMSFSYGSEISVVRSLEPWKSLVNKYIMHQKIAKAISADSKTE